MDTISSEKALVRARIAALRTAMKQEMIEALLVPSSDPHLSEYLPGRWKSREWLSGFTGSMGTLLVTPDKALLFADSRYWLQAEAEIAGTGIELFKVKTSASQVHFEWLAENVPTGKTVCVDGSVLGLTPMRALETALGANSIKLRTDCDLLALVWKDRPALPTEPVYQHLPPHATTTRSAKLAATRAAMALAGAQWHFISTVDDIGYLFNLRGSDVKFNPVFIAHALIGKDSALLFVMPGKIPPDVEAILKKDGVKLAPYVDARSALSGLPAGSVVLLDPRRITYNMREAVPSTVKVVEAVNPTTFAKSRKNAQEADFVRHAMEMDGAAMAEFYAWFEQALGRERITEVTVDEKITAARARREGFVSASFSTIAGFNSNGALNHYRAVPATAAAIEGNGLLLIDSGGQYLGGTTDITRVWPVGSITAEHKRDCTLVLKAVIALSTAQFPRGVKSPYLDSLARAPIWAAGIDYGHGTGHGVGYFMNVHEGPQTISQGMPDAHTAMEPGMITSIEPGIYREGKWGVRIENLALNVAGDNKDFGEFLKFETLTLCPIDTRCIETGMLRQDEIAWLNNYHAEVTKRLLPHVAGDAKAWLLARTKPV